MFFYKKRSKGKKKNKGGGIMASFRKNGKSSISYAQMQLINDRILSKKRLIVYAESEM